MVLKFVTYFKIKNMLTIIVLGSIGFILAWIVIINGGFDWDNLGIGLLMLILFTVIGALIALMLPVSYSTDKYDVRLQSLQDNSTIKGNFFLGCGSINGTMKYVFYSMGEDSTFTLQQVDYTKAKIKHSDKHATQHISFTHPKKSIWERWGIDFNEETYEYIFEVPFGTVKNDLNLDAQ